MNVFKLGRVKGFFVLLLLAWRIWSLFPSQSEQVLTFEVSSCPDSMVTRARTVVPITDLFVSDFMFQPTAVPKKVAVVTNIDFQGWPAKSSENRQCAIPLEGKTPS